MCCAIMSVAERESAPVSKKNPEKESCPSLCFSASPSVRTHQHQHEHGRAHNMIDENELMHVYEREREKKREGPCLCCPFSTFGVLIWFLPRSFILSSPSFAPHLHHVNIQIHTDIVQCTQKDKRTLSLACSLLSFWILLCHLCASAHVSFHSFPS